MKEWFLKVNTIKLSWFVIIANFLDFLSTRLAVHVLDLGWAGEKNEWVKQNYYMGFGYQILIVKLIYVSFIFFSLGYIAQHTNRKWLNVAFKIVLIYNLVILLSISISNFLVLI